MQFNRKQTKHWKVVFCITHYHRYTNGTIRESLALNDAFAIRIIVKIIFLFQIWLHESTSALIQMYKMSSCCDIFPL